MMRQSKKWLASALVAVAVAGCFSDPTDGMRNGPSRMVLSNSHLVLRTGDSIAVQVLVEDEQGNQLAVESPQWSAVDVAVAAVRPDSASPSPGNIFSRAFVRGVTPASGQTLVIVTANGLTDTVTVTVIPSGLAAGSAAVGNDAAFGANTKLTINAPTNITFSTAAPVSAVFIGSTAAIVLTRTATTITAISPAAVTGTVMVTNVTASGLAVDSVRSSGSVTISASNLPGTLSATNTGRLLDTIRIWGGGAATFATSGADSAQVTVNGVGAFVLRRTVDSIYVIAKLSGTSNVAVAPVFIGATRVSQLTSGGTITVAATTGEPGEPGNNASGGASAVAGLNAVNDSVIIYGATNGSTDDVDYYTFTMPAAGGRVSVQLLFFGNGSGSSDINPDFDVLVCTTLSGGGACGYGQDRIPSNAGSGTVNPEAGTSSAIAGGTTVYVTILTYYATAGGGPGAHRLKIKVVP